MLRQHRAPMKATSSIMVIHGWTRTAVIGAAAENMVSTAGREPIKDVHFQVELF